MSKLAKTLQAAAGNAGGGEYVEDVFSTYLYTGNGSTQTINNGIDLDGEGGLVWIKARNVAIQPILVDTTMPKNVRYAALSSDRTSALGADESDMTSFNSNGFTLQNYQGTTNGNTNTHASWTFRKAPKFFDIVTYTGTGGSLDVSHALDSSPGCVMVKRTDTASDWVVGHRGSGSYWASETLRLNTNASGVTNGEFGAWSSTIVRVVNSGGSYGDVNTSGGTYVMYLFAHNAGGFGDDGEQDVISCGSFTTDSNQDADINLGYEPQFILVKRSASQGDWWLIDNMRGMSVTDTNYLSANTAAADASIGGTGFINPTATGFSTRQGIGSSAACIYIALRRPMKTPESGTEVFNTVFRNASSGLPQWNSGFVTDFTITMDRTGSGNTDTVDRLRGPKRLLTNSTSAESNGSPATSWDYMDGRGSSAGSLYDGQFALMFKRAPSFMDVVCYTGTGVAKTEAHNLGVVPELMIVKNRSLGGTAWPVYSATIGASSAMYLQLTNGAFAPTAVFWNNTAPTSSVFTISTHGSVNTSSNTYVAYLFASLAGVSKVGSYSGTGNAVNVDCGFSGGARFVMIKRTDSTGDWYVWNSLTGIVAGNDPYLLLNSATIEVTNTDYIDPLSSGFTVTSSAPAALNASGGTYIFLAIA